MAICSRDAVKVYYETIGKGPPVLLVHGLGQDSGIWRDLGYLDRLGVDHQVICVDARGHGQSDKPGKQKDYLLAEFVADFVGILDSLSIAKVHYLGYSMGGRLGYAFLKYAPERLASVLIGGSSPFETPRRKIDVATASDIGPLGLEIESLLSEPLSPEFLRGRSLAELNALAAVISAQWPDLTEGLGNETVPVGLFCGDRDYRYANMKKVCRMFPGHRIETLTGMTHADAICDAGRVEGIFRALSAQSCAAAI